MKKNYRIRQATSSEQCIIYDLIKKAFETAKVKDGDEQDFANNLRQQGGYIDELELVAEFEQQIVGHIMFTRTAVKQKDGSLYQVLLLAPISVLEEFRSQGIGSGLINEGCRLAIEKGFSAVVLCGDPAYYERFDFKPTIEHGIQLLGNIPPQYVMVKELIPHALDNVEGEIDIC